MPNLNSSGGSFIGTIILLLLLTNCKTESPLFKQLDSTQTGVTFENKLTETETQNVLAYEYFYNGGGMAAADFNNDGKVDLFFAGNQVGNKLYLNQSEGTALKFEDITQKAFPNTATDSASNWKTGVAIADVNADGWLDIYLCHAGNGTPSQRKNQLFINSGLESTVGSPRSTVDGSQSTVQRPTSNIQRPLTFTEQAEAYGIADVGYSTHATFFDYDLDGDLDLFVLNHNLKGYQRKEAAIMKAAVDEYAGDRLYRNDSPLTPRGGNKKIPPSGVRAVRRAGLFVDVTLAAGIKSNALGFGLGVVVSDFNQDNLPDLYVANDYVEEDYLYLNKGNGTFDEVGKEAFGHFSYSAMGVDAADFNNDGLPDLFTADMLPEDNRRQKLLAFPDNWNVQKSMVENGFHWQNMRNMLQLNQTLNKTAPPSGAGGAAFSEIGQLAGVSSTDWSWAPLFADFDNDGLKDLFVSNGFVRDLTDLDFVKYYSDQEAQKQGGGVAASLLEQLKQMPSTPTHHYIFKNNGDLTFSNRVQEWGFEQQTIGCGAAYADLDNDGDLDLVTNNTNEPARIYQNQSQQQKPTNYLKIKLKGANLNPFGLGTKALVYVNGQMQYQECWPTHGFQSSMLDALHFGIGQATKIDSLRLVWPSGKTQLIRNQLVNKTILANEVAASGRYEWPTIKPLFEPTETLNFAHQENPNIDFNRQVLLPRMYSCSGPRFATGDVNADGLTDVFVTGAKDQAGALFLQTKNGDLKPTVQTAFVADAASEDVDAVFFDADGDRDLDLYVASGGYEQQLESTVFQDRLYLNNGKGQFSKSEGSIPIILTNKCAVKTLDFDRDGDQDLFLAGTVRAGLYPYSEPNYLLKNNGKGQFSVAQKIESGLVMDVAVADVNNDKFPDVVLVGELMPVGVLINQKGKFANEPQPLFEHSAGWYGRILATDLDKDGDVDFVLGNIGNNTPLRASAEKPLLLYYGDADQNGSIDPLIFNYMGDLAYPITGRDETLEQMASLRKKFIDYKSYSLATVKEIFDEATLAKMKVAAAEQTQTGVLINEKGKFIWKPLPILAQAAPVHAILADDFNHDGFTDILLAGNESLFRIRIGKTDANKGLVLLGNGKNEFKPIPQSQSGLDITGDVRDLIQLNKQLIFGINNGQIRSFWYE